LRDSQTNAIRQDVFHARVEAEITLSSGTVRKPNPRVAGRVPFFKSSFERSFDVRGRDYAPSLFSWFSGEASHANTRQTRQRMGRDSNPWWTFAHYSFQDCRLKPLGHPSKFLPRKYLRHFEIRLKLGPTTASDHRNRNNMKNNKIPTAIHNNIAGTKSKPDKPYPEFPLCPRNNGQWGKKIHGKIYTFGPWANPELALARYLKEKEYLEAGRLPPTRVEGITVKELLNLYHAAKLLKVETGELSARSFTDYKYGMDVVNNAFGRDAEIEKLQPADFTKLRDRLLKKYSPVRVGVLIQYVRSIFKYGYDMRMYKAPVHFGPDFMKPNKRVMRADKKSKSKKLFSASVIQELIMAATSWLKPAILLGINCGFGPTDCALLPIDAVNLKTGWLNFPRPKTGIDRRVPLWTETVQAIRDYLKIRRRPRDEADSGMLFINQRGQAMTVTKNSSWRVSGEMARLLQELYLHQLGVGFYALRHTFATVGGGAKDRIAVKALLGHVSSDVLGEFYEEELEDGDRRLLAVTDYVRNWLFADAPSKPQ
jgi:integrase